MKLLSYSATGRCGIACENGGEWLDLSAADGNLPSDIAGLLQNPEWKIRVNAAKAKAKARALDPGDIGYLAPLRGGEKILCVGLNYQDHVKESPYPSPTYPVFFPRFASSLLGHLAPLVRPAISAELDYEGEIAIVIGRKGRHIAQRDALSHVAGYTLFNDGSVRDFQFKAPQWTMGKNFDNTGACGPWFVSADELPAGADGLTLQTRVNGAVVQNSNTSDMIFDVSQLISIASNVMTLKPGDMIVSGTPSGVGFARKPPVFLQPGDICEVSAEGLGVLRNPVIDEVL
ncbi:MAG: fumarylacetoacetate hydrolase family protein, partial [Porticoccaceae bacterium]